MKCNETFNGYDCMSFEFENTTGYIVFPKGKANGKIAFKTEYRTAFPELELELLKRGFHVVHIDNKTRLANKADCDIKARFIEYVSQQYKLESRCVLIGMSCGGAQAVNFASHYCQYVACLVIDAPVLNFLDFPGKYNKYESIWDDEFKAAYPGVKRSDIFTMEYNPINNVPKLIENRFPIIMLYGTEDATVNYLENGKLLEEAYSDNMELLIVIPRVAQGHHPHGLLDKSGELAELVISKVAEFHKELEACGR